MSTARQELQEALCRYTTDTITSINSVRGFCEGNSKWLLQREKELNVMKMTAHMRPNELAAVLKDTLEGLDKLDCFLDAVEKLAVTSLHVFTDNPVLHLPKELSLEDVQFVISVARMICPHLLEFKRDAKVFFFPRLQNVEVLSYQLDKYIQTTKKICDSLEKSCFSEFSPKMTVGAVVDLDVGFSEDDIRRMLDHINQLDEIRINQSFRMVFLFQDEPCSVFISKFSERQPRMLQFLAELEENAVQLDRMNKGAKISSVAGSSVGAVGGVLSIVGLALIPFTAGVSLGLTMTGMGLGVTSGVNSIVTTATEIGVNRKHQKKASEVFQSFTEDVQTLQDCLDQVINMGISEIDVALGVFKILFKANGVRKGIDSFRNAVSDYKMLKSGYLNVRVGKVVAQEGKALGNVPRVASDIPDIGQAAVKGPLALTKSARAGLIAVNALFLGMDIFFICKDSITLAKGTETEVSQFIRARSKLWKSEMDSWLKIHDSLCEGLPRSEKNKALLDTPFYSETGEK
ncbi:uncharacterized protein LOC113155813 [Anabas testudineus]|nr:uncharacterized protein LOC113155813 [Anabas testudineus]